MDDTLKNLFKSNAQWAQAMKAADPGFFERSVKSQSPKVRAITTSLPFCVVLYAHGFLGQILWLGCSDSRVPESVITASRPGDIFVHRNIANQVHLTDDNVLSVITYAVAKVGVEHSTPALHTHTYI